MPGTALVVLLVLIVAVTAMHFDYQSRKADAGDPIGWAEWVLERWGWRILLIGSGLAALAIVAASLVFAMPKFAQRGQFLLVALYGAFSTSLTLGFAQEKFSALAAHRYSPDEAVFSRRFKLSLVIVAVLGAGSIALSVVAYTNMLEINRILASRLARWKLGSPWVFGAILVCWCVSVVRVPFATVAKRKMVEVWRGDAKLKELRSADFHRDGGKSNI